MTTRPTASHLGSGLPVDSRGRPEDPLAPARGLCLGIALGAALWAGAVLMVRTLL